MRAHLALALLLISACKTSDPLYCDEDTPCTDPDRPYCDLTGEYPASDGHGRTCIANPFDGGVGDPDGGGGDPDGPDAAVPRRIAQISVGSLHSCARFNDGGLRCWGSSQLGYGGDDVVGDNEAPYEAGDIVTGGRVASVAVGNDYTCILYEAGNVRCWGSPSQGKLGYGNLSSKDGPVDDVPIGGKAVQITSGSSHTCVLVEGGLVRCWGDSGTGGKLGYGHPNDIGDNETPDSQDPVVLGGTPIQISAGSSHTCALLEGGRVQCWGNNGTGVLGYGDVDNPIVGDNEDPADAGDVNVGGEVISIAAGSGQTCAVLEGGDVRCWGSVDQVGHPEIDEDLGDDETPAGAGDVMIGGNVEQVVSNGGFNCARLTSGSVRCWGTSNLGQLGYGDTETVGDDETPASAGNVSLGGDVAFLAQGGSATDTCAVLEDLVTVRCWGANGQYQLGLGHNEDVGDTELPDSQDPVQVLDPE